MNAPTYLQPHTRHPDLTWRNVNVSHFQCLICGQLFQRPNPTLHTRGVRRWAVGFSQSSSRKGLNRALKSNHRRRCLDNQHGPLLPNSGPLLYSFTAKQKKGKVSQ